MTVNELIHILQEQVKISPAYGDKTVVIRDSKKRIGIGGGTPVIPVYGIFSGFDWNNNHMIIEPEKDMMSCTEETGDEEDG